ncbi:MAG: hypothetical protein SCK29_01305 [Bacillota bacterium]|nr:hypothetical protein [Bacillota bacterium]MDW7682737.1 hypothetical protein [Bacillota bacterium]
MESSLSVALDDIRIIKNSIGESKSRYEKVYKFLLLLGIVNLGGFLLETFGLMMLSFPTLDRYFIFSFIINAVMYLLLFVYFVRVYKEEKISSNKYYLGFLSIFAGIVFLLPILKILMRFLVSLAVHYQSIGKAFIVLNDISMISNILLFCFIIVLCGFLLGKRSMFFASSIIFLFYLIISVIYSDITFTLPFSKRPDGYGLSLLWLYYSCAISIGYIILAILLKNRSRVNNADGTK